MKTSRKYSAGRYFFGMIIAGVIFSGAAEAKGPAGNPQRPVNEEAAAWEHCGCDNQKEIESYVQNIINDAQQRGMTCYSAKMHTQACINVYCSICQGHPGLVESCIETASNYFLNSPGFCLQQKSQGQMNAFFANLPL